MRCCGRRAAAIYSLIESAKLNGLNPQHYFADVLDRIADHPRGALANSCPGTGNRSTPPALPPEPARSPNAYFHTAEVDIERDRPSDHLVSVTFAMAAKEFAEASQVLKIISGEIEAH